MRVRGSSPRGRGAPRGARWLAGFAVAALASLAFFARADAPRQKACTLPGSRPWREYRTAHFVIDASTPSDAERLVGTFEELHAAVLAALVSTPVDVPGRVRVIVAPSRLDLERIAGRRPGLPFSTNVSDPALLGNSLIGEPALFWVNRLGEPTILVAAEDVADAPQTIAHELAHYLSRHLFARQSYWFREGLAQFVESVGRPDSDGKRWAGADPTTGQAGTIKLTHAAELMSGSGGFFNDPYLTTWVLYRFLWNEHGKQLEDYQGRLMDGEAPRAAWRAAFPQWNLDGSLRDLDVELARHQTAGRGLRWEVKVGAVDRAFTSVAASSADVHMILLEPTLTITNELAQPRLRREVAEEAQREEPGHPAATVELASVDGTNPLPALRAAAAQREADGRSWYLLAREATDPAEREAALRRATKLWPDGALAHTLLAAHLASTGRAREGLAFANRGLELAPWSPDAIAALAKVALELGKCPQAKQLQARAVDIAEAGTIGPILAGAGDLRRQLEECARRCAAAAGSSTQAPPAGGR